MNWMDIITAIIFVLAGIQGYAKGFIRSFVNTTSWIVSVVCAIKFYPVISYYLVSFTPIYSKINCIINEKVKAVSNMNMKNTSFDSTSFIKLPDVLDQLWSGPDVSLEGIVGNSLSEVVSKLLVDIISIVLIIIAVKVFLAIISSVLDNFAQLPVLKQMNRFSGLLFGFIKGGIIIFIILAVCVPVIGVTENDFLIRSLENSTVTKYLYHHNLLLFFIKQAAGSILPI